MMVAMAAVLAIVPALSGIVPTLARSCQTAAERFVDSAGYASSVLEGKSSGMMAAGEPAAPTLRGISFGTAGALLALGIAALSLFQQKLPRLLRRVAPAIERPILPALHAIHSGDIRDCVAWLSLGVALFGGAVVYALG
jgi:hypothetical protein